ncbi:hypothetical protein CLFE_013210 [Clostridium felsineum DSM 794]|nr:hypothetical protein CLFE_013210 [Clostridium felsineum DSM 794]
MTFSDVIKDLMLKDIVIGSISSVVVIIALYTLYTAMWCI